MNGHGRRLVALGAVLAFGGDAVGQQGGKTPAAPMVVRISTEIIQVDAVVTGKDDRYVSDLGPADFEILEDGRKQEITLCSYVPLEEPEPAPSTAGPAAPKPAAPRRESVRRTMAFLVDDLSLGFQGTLEARKALTRFVDEQMRPGDFVAILQTGAGSGALQQFTSDKRVLRAGIERLRFNLASRGGITPLGISGSGGNASAPAAAGGGGAGEGQAAVARLAAEMSAFDTASTRERQLHLAVGTIGSLQFVLRGLQNMPGRKSLVFMSEGFSQKDRWGERSEIYEKLKALTDLANRASVVVYTLEPGGLKTLGSTAEAGASTTVLDSRLALDEIRGGLGTLAEETGGLFLADSNDITRSVGKVLDDQKGYYLIGYNPDDSTFKPEKSGPKYHKIQLRVKRPGLRVRSRKGFYGVVTAGEEAPVAAGRQQLANAVYSPFVAPDLGVRLTSLFGNDPKTGSYVRSLLHMDVQGMTFQEQPDGSRKTELEIAAMTFGADGFAVERTARSETITIRPEFYEQARRGGLVYSLDVPIKKAGAYQLRTAVRDVASGRLGSATQFVEVPDLGHDRLALSGLIMSGAAAPMGGDGPGGSPTSEMDPDSTPAVRRFHRGSAASYALAIYNARVPSAAARPQLLVRLSLYRDDRLAQAMPAMPFDGAGQADPRRLALAGSFRLGSTMEPGRYVLEVAVQDLAAGPKAGPAAQWMDFEVVE